MRRLKYILPIILLLLGTTGCFHKPDETIVFLGPESYVKSIKEIVQNDTWENDLLSHLDGVIEGYFPPNIEGEYKISEKQFVTSNFTDLSDHLDMYLKVEHQHNRIASVDLYEGESVYTDTAFIMGNQQWFTLYFKEKRELEYQGVLNAHHRLVVISGRKADEGIANLYFGTLILDPGENVDPLVGSFIPGWYFIYKDKDGLSENCDWFSSHQEEGEEDE